MKTVFIICIFVYVVCGNEEDFRTIDSIIQEEPCASQGGICTVAADCPKGHLAEKPDLCPKQRKHGVECCHGQSLKELRCQKRGGACIKLNDFCNIQLIFEAEDCPSGRKCCMLV
ncbi:unnamed protein product [Pieris macdunnoughi]|uniref:Carboxypeptidase inhibitor n=1 Tax=Pieris macdunnoughi TaxID=345717 RepID=A0A821UVW7_9NEOP|nr:unnamed protein product [Pieris macdunnoughi]